MNKQVLLFLTIWVLFCLVSLPSSSIAESSNNVQIATAQVKAGNLINEGKAEEALTILDSLPATNDIALNLVSKNARARAYAALKEWDKSIVIYQEIVEHPEMGWALRREFAGVLKDAGRLSEAYDELLKHSKSLTTLYELQSFRLELCKFEDKEDSRSDKKTLLLKEIAEREKKLGKSTKHNQSIERTADAGAH